MVRTISATEAKVNFGAVTQQVIDDGEPVVAKNHGQTRVAIVPVHQLHRLAELEEQERRRAWLKRVRGAVHRERESHGTGRKLVNPIANERTDGRVRAALGDERYRACIQEGRAIPYGQLLAELRPAEFAMPWEPPA